MNNRTKRIGELIREETSRVLREKVADPRIGFTSITDVNVSPDLKNAQVYVSVYGTDKNKNETMAGLKSAVGYIQGEVGRTLNLRYTPRFTFVLDKSIERGSRVLVIMSKLEKEARESKNLFEGKKRAPARRPTRRPTRQSRRK